jgi:hypothetical protein
LLLLLRRRGRRALQLQANDFVISQNLFEAVRLSVLEGRRLAQRLSLQRTLEQLQNAIGWDGPVGPGPFSPGLHELTLQHQVAAQSEAHAVSSRFLESKTEGGRKFLPEWERRASWEADQAFNESRRRALLELPPRVRAELWLRWDTAGDDAVCPSCFEMEGHTVRASQGFDHPPPLHGKCRCSETIITAGEA